MFEIEVRIPILLSETATMLNCYASSMLISFTENGGGGTLFSFLEAIRTTAYDCIYLPVYLYLIKTSHECAAAEERWSSSCSQGAIVRLSPLSPDLQAPAPAPGARQPPPPVPG